MTWLDEGRFALMAAFLVSPIFWRWTKQVLSPIRHGWAVLLAGIASNFTVTVSNGWKMPVIGIGPWDVIGDERHSVVTATTHLLPLVDRFDIGRNIYSAGDVLLITGLVMAASALVYHLVVATLEGEL